MSGWYDNDCVNIYQGMCLEESSSVEGYEIIGGYGSQGCELWHDGGGTTGKIPDKPHQPLSPSKNKKFERFDSLSYRGYWVYRYCHIPVVPLACSDGEDGNSNGYYDEYDAFCQAGSRRNSRDFNSCELIFGENSFSIIRSNGECRGSCGEGNVYVTSDTGHLPPFYGQQDGEGISSLDLCGSAGLKCCIPEESNGYDLLEINLCSLAEPQDYFGCIIEEIEYCTDSGDCFYGGQYGYGCMDENANNYDDEAILDDGSCDFTTICWAGDFGDEEYVYDYYDSFSECEAECENELGSEYDWFICLYENVNPYDVLDFGCTNPDAFNYDDDANMLDDSCIDEGECVCGNWDQQSACSPGVPGGYMGCDYPDQAPECTTNYPSCGPCTCGDYEIPEPSSCNCWWDDYNPGSIPACRASYGTCSSCSSMCAQYSEGFGGTESDCTGWYESC